jgi:O-antigen ligase
MLFLIGLLIAIAGVFGLIVSALLPLTFVVATALVLSTVQLYTIPVAGVYLSGSHLAALASWRAVGEPIVWRQSWFRACLAMLAVQAASTAWSPAPVQAIRQLLYSAIFVFLVPAAYHLLQKNPARVRRAVTIGLYATLIEAFLVIVFRALPGLKIAFLTSGVSRFFLSANFMAEMFNGAYTFADPGKSGGFLLNANVGAAFLGVSAMLAWGAARLFRSKWLMVVATVDFIGVLAAGSKAAMGIGFLLIAMIYVLNILRAKQMDIAVAATICFGLVFAIIGGFVLAPLLMHSQYAAGSSETLQVRFAIWDFGFSVLKAHVLTGLGFGGWELKWPEYAFSRGLSPFFPPHNAFLQLFVQSGILAPVFGLLFVFFCLRFAWRDIGSDDEDHRRFALGAFASLMWIFVQAQGENYGLIGEVHITPLFAATMALLLHFRQDGAVKTWKTLE